MIVAAPLSGRNEPTPEKHARKNGWFLAYCSYFGSCVFYLFLCLLCGDSISQGFGAQTSFNQQGIDASVLVHVHVHLFAIKKKKSEELPPKRTLLQPSFTAWTHLEVFDRLHGPGVDLQLILAEPPFQQLFVREFKGDFLVSSHGHRGLEFFKGPPH